MPFRGRKRGKRVWAIARPLLGLLLIAGLCSCQSVRVADSSAVSGKPSRSDLAMTSLSQERAFSILQRYYRVSSAEVDLVSWERLVFAPDQENEVVCIAYRDHRFDARFLDVFLIRPGPDNAPELMLREDVSYGTGISDYDWRVLEFEGSRYFVLWNTAGSGRYMGVTVYEYLPVGALQAVWTDPVGGLMGAYGMVSEGALYADFGGGKYEKLAYRDGEFRMVDASLRYDLESAPWLQNSDGQSCRLTITPGADSIGFRILGSKLYVAKTPETQEGDTVSWRHYTVRTVVLEEGQLLRIVSEKTRKSGGLRVVAPCGSCLEQKPGNPWVFLAKAPGKTHVHLGWPGLTYRLEVEVVERGAPRTEMQRPEPDTNRWKRAYSPPVTSESSRSPQGLTHVISAGETLESIATMYDCTVSDLKKANPTTGTGTELKAGGQLQIPFPAPGDQ